MLLNNKFYTKTKFNVIVYNAIKVRHRTLKMNGNTTNIDKCCVKDMTKYYSTLYKSSIARVVESATIEWE